MQRADVSDPILVPEFLWTGAWESRHNLTDRFAFTLTIPKVNLALRLEVLDRRPAAGVEAFTESFDGETSGKAFTQPGFGLYHLSTDSRLLYGVLDNYGLPARIRNVWTRGVPYEEARAATSADLKTAPSSTAVPQGYAYLESPRFSLGPGTIQGFVSFAANDAEERARAFGGGAGYALGKKKFRLEGFYTERTLAERKSSTWFNEKPALPERDTRLFAGAAAFSVPAFGLAADIAHSETFAFGQDYYGSLGLRFGDKPWRFSLALDGAGSRYVDSAGGVPGSGLRAAARLERRGKKTAFFRVSTLVRGPGAQDDFAAITKNFNRMSGELYYRFPANAAAFGLTRFSFFLNRDGRDEKKTLDSAGSMAAFKLGPVNSVSEGKLTGIKEKSYQFNSYRFSQSLSYSIQVFRKAGPGIKNSSRLGVSKGIKKKGSFTVQMSTRAAYEKTAPKDGIWETSFSVSIRGKKSRLTLKAATPNYPEKWEYTISWRIQL